MTSCARRRNQAVVVLYDAESQVATGFLSLRSSSRRTSEYKACKRLRRNATPSKRQDAQCMPRLAIQVSNGPGVGDSVGAMVGSGVGAGVGGPGVGATVGRGVGFDVGRLRAAVEMRSSSGVGLGVGGRGVGCAVGREVGIVVGAGVCGVGMGVGTGVGTCVGTGVGIARKKVSHDGVGAGVPADFDTAR